ncbi:16S rRNA methyltransferase [[Bacillus] enclensis]|uniref:Ribosomal RNA small subunit methyltransferase I n=1 Tax=[Bacillus] enclensis TaxID=1402860 RepID=A0A0V8H5R3_9BACI|nr:16S rRNA (cytidine(1402)-2'-O)-methyltransferase [[Bacillus] enclensis]KSU57813.1 16S rRNA methyltransferase [[Bacillus] enclensis]SCC36217.1 16S rRNA (cytidine1402-2'-O)-methyltransferase [[Bacillus] enclensis]
MNQQKSYQETGKGRLYLVPTPIGNLEDMTFRAIRIMKEADVIAAEDTRNTKKLSNYFEIDTPIISYHEHNKESSGPKLIERMEQGETVALVSDAGMPSISDPGYELVQAAIENNLAVIPLPGANAALTALIASGLAPQPFYFYGFLHRGKKEKRAELERLRSLKDTFILYESPHRLKETLKELHQSLGNRQIVICRELTKKFEEFIRGSSEDVLEWAETGEIRGEFCVMVEGNPQPDEEEQEEWWNDYSIEGHVQYYIEEKEMSSKSAIKEVAKERNLPKREVYQAFHVEK